MLSGAVSESTLQGARPIEGARIGVWVQEVGFGHALGGGTTDAEGHYRISGLPDSFILLYASKDGYLQPCAATVTLRADSALDIALVSEASLSGASPSAPMAAVSPTLSGGVFETTPEGRQPVEGVEIEVDWLPDLVTATTRSDAAGRYLLCSLPTGFIDVFASKLGYELTDVAVQFNSDTVLDLEMKRQ